MINIDRFEALTSWPIQGNIQEKTPEQAHVSKVESEKGPEEEKMKFKKISKTEKELIEECYRGLKINVDWDELQKACLEKCPYYLPQEMVLHYKYLYRNGKLKDRLRNYIQRGKRLTLDKET
jgi:hypothetical protein